jgi:hypothetical protein
MAVVVLTSDNIGDIVQTNGTLNSIVLTAPPAPGVPEPPSFDLARQVYTGRYLQLIDDSGPGVPRNIFCMDLYTTKVSQGSVLLNNANGIPFAQLRCASAPGRGARITVTTNP